MRASPPPVVFMPQHRPDDLLPPRPMLATSTPDPVPMAANGAHRLEIPVARSVAPSADRGPMMVGDPGVGATVDRRAGLRRRRYGQEPQRDGLAVTPASATGTLRMLPGRLEVVEGHPADREIRFIAEPGLADQRFTMGRGEGPPNQHVRLQGQTVSRLHAALTYDDGRWAIENLSSTNPLRVNGQAVDAETAMVLLTEGDLIELGEVVLRFHE